MLSYVSIKIFMVFSLTNRFIGTKMKVNIGLFMYSSIRKTT